MAATILNSPRAAAMSAYIVRAFVRLRSLLESNAQIARKLHVLESVAVLDADTKRQFKELPAVVFGLASPPAKEQYRMAPALQITMLRLQGHKL